MPQRTNTFQQVMALVYWLLAEDDVKVEESVLLPDRDTGQLREVDVLLTGKVGGMSMTVQIEATTRKRPVDSKWVEEEIGLHESVGTDRLILISESGFRKPARTKAEAKGAIPIQPSDFEDGEAVGEIVNRLGAVFPKFFELTPQKIWGRAEKPDGEIVHITDLSLDTQIFLETGGELGTIDTEIRRRMDSDPERMARDIGLPDIAGDSDAKFTLGMPDWAAPVDGQTVHACVQWNEVDPPEFHRIVEIQVQGFAEIRVAEIDLTHKKMDSELGKLSLSYGTGKLGDKDVLVVITEDENGGKAALRFS